MARLSNSQGLLFVEITSEETNVEGTQGTTLKGWFGAQQVGQIKALVTSTVIEHKGVVTHTVEDCILCSFADALPALNASLAIQRKVTKTQNPSKGMIVKVRIGLAYGPVRVFAGKVSGDTVTAAGTLLAKAPAGETLADQAMRDAVGSPKEVRMEAAGVLDGITAYRVVSLATSSSSNAVDITRTIVPVAKPAAAPPAPAAAAVAPASSTVPPSPMASTEPAAAPIPPTVVPPAKPSVGGIVLTFAGVEYCFGPSDGEIVMGRSKDIQITVPSAQVSRKHAKIVFESEGAVYLVNMSQNGSCVRFASTGQEHSCMEKIRLEGSGEIALCAGFSQISSQAEVISFSPA
ncbi:MAG: FHA domain-containing protein [Betaproteobacteria bacterium]|nr:FHA domain-containing protein [Betaproteobacteria bacterium]